MKNRVIKTCLGIYSREMFNAMNQKHDILCFLLNQQRLRKLTENYVVSNAKIKRALGIEKMPVSAKEGMRKTLDSFR